MKVLIFGDIYGRIGRNAFLKNFPSLYEKYNPDFVVVNAENISSGKWPVEKHMKELDRFPIDVYTSGNHIFDNEEEIRNYLEKEDSKLIRPLNFYESDLFSIPGKWYKVVEKNGKKLLVINLMSQIFMRDDMYNPFLKMEEFLKTISPGDYDGIIVDFHRETTSETYAMGMLLDGRVSFVFGTHTHIQTNDELILPGGTWLLTDVGMSGPLYSIIGADFDSMKKRFLTWMAKGKIAQCLDKHYVVSGVCVEIDENTWHTIHLEKIRVRGSL